MNKKGCVYCGGKLKLTNKEIIKKFHEHHGNKYDYSLVNYKNLKTKIKIICPIHGIFEQTPDSHKSKGCPLCSKIDTNDFINNAILVHVDKYDYKHVNYISAKTKIKIICNKHGIFEQTPNNHLSGKGCPRCFDSKGENLIRNFLESNNIKYINQKTFKDCKYKKSLRFDFLY